MDFVVLASRNAIKDRPDFAMPLSSKLTLRQILVCLFSVSFQVIFLLGKVFERLMFLIYEG